MGSLQRLLTYCKLFSALVLPRVSARLSPADVALYSTPPPPAANAFIKKRAVAEPSSSAIGPGNPARQEASGPHARYAVPPRALIPHLLAARQRACAAFAVHLQAEEHQELLRYLVSKGARVA